MTPVEFPGVNVVFGKDQPEYRPLPAMKMPDGEVITCYELTDEEMAVMVKTKRIYFAQLTFNRGFNPIMPMVELSDGVSLSE